MKRGKKGEKCGFWKEMNSLFYESLLERGACGGGSTSLLPWFLAPMQTHTSTGQLVLGNLICSYSFYLLNKFCMCILNQYKNAHILQTSPLMGIFQVKQIFSCNPNRIFFGIILKKLFVSCYCHRKHSFFFKFINQIV